MEINKNNFVIIGSEKNVKSNLGDTKFFIQERKDEDGQPGKVEKLVDGKGSVNAIAESYIREGFDPSKIIINGEPATDVLHLNKDRMKEINRAPARIGIFGFQKIGKFTDEQVAEMNEKKTLPEGQYIVFTPKINHYMDGIYTNTSPASALINKAKDKDLAKWSDRGIKYTNKVPNQYKIVNDNGKTYFVEKNTDIKKAKHDYKKQATIILSIIGGVIATGAAIIKLALRK